MNLREIRERRTGVNAIRAELQQLREDAQSLGGQAVRGRVLSAPSSPTEDAAVLCVMREQQLVDELRGYYTGRQEAREKIARIDNSYECRALTLYFILGYTQEDAADIMRISDRHLRRLLRSGEEKYNLLT